MSVAGGLHHAIEHAVNAGCDCLQIFVKNQRQWKAPPLEDADVQAWTSALGESGIDPVVAHASYLVNLASPEAENRKRGMDALVDELRRCDRLGVSALIFHPGAHMGEGEASGLRRIVTALRQVLRRTSKVRTQILLENTAGQGTALGWRFEHLAEIIEGVDAGERVGVCLDTCHVFAAGYDIRKPSDYARTVDEFDRIVGLDRLICIHGNDSLRECGSRVDRHAHVGQGQIGRGGFRSLVNDPRLAHVPIILETPKGLDDKGRDLDRLNLSVLRNLVSKRGARRASRPASRV